MTRSWLVLSIALVTVLAGQALFLRDGAGTAQTQADPAAHDTSAAADDSSDTQPPGKEDERPSAEEIKAKLADPAFLSRARAYTRGNYWLFLADSLLSFAAFVFLVFTGVSAAAWRWIEGRTGGGARAKLLYIAGLIIFMSLISLPLDYYDNFVREHDYGFSTQTSAAWFYDRLKALLITIPIAALFVIPVYAFIRKFPRTWWMMGAALGVLFAVILIVIAPVFIDPIFNKFTPLADQDLKKTILDLAHRNGIEADDVYEMDASTRSVHDNAYVTGLLGTQRIVLYDVLLKS